MSIKDFQAKQLRGHQIIASSSDVGNVPGIMVYSASAATSYVGGYDASLLTGVGSDVFMFVSGAKSDATGLSADWPTVRDEVVLFGGDVVISGTMFAEHSVIEIDGNVTGSMSISGSLVVSQSAYVGEGLNVNTSREHHAENRFFVYGTNTALSSSTLIKGDPNTSQVFILSGGKSDSFDEAAATDVAFYVSGTVGSHGTKRSYGTALIGGDAVVSGSLSISALAASPSTVLPITASLVDIGWYPPPAGAGSGGPFGTTPILRLTAWDWAIANGENVGEIQFFGVDTGEEPGGMGASIKAVADEHWNDNDFATALHFSTTEEGASSPTLRMAINHSGSVGIAQQNPFGRLHVRTDPGDNQSALFVDHKETGAFPAAYIKSLSTSEAALDVHGMFGGLFSTDIEQGWALKAETQGSSWTTFVYPVVEFVNNESLNTKPLLQLDQYSLLGDAFHVKAKQDGGSTSTVFRILGNGQVSILNSTQSPRADVVIGKGDARPTVFLNVGSPYSGHSGSYAFQQNNGSSLGGMIWGRNEYSTQRQLMLVVSGARDEILLASQDSTNKIQKAFLFRPHEYHHAGGGDYSGPQVLILSGATSEGALGTDHEPRKAYDTNFWVSGSIGSRDTFRRGTAVFGGDSAISGSLYFPGPAAQDWTAEIQNIDDGALVLVNSASNKNIILKGNDDGILKDILTVRPENSQVAINVTDFSQLSTSYPLVVSGTTSYNTSIFVRGSQIVPRHSYGKTMALTLTDEEGSKAAYTTLVQHSGSTPNTWEKFYNRRRVSGAWSYDGVSLSGYTYDDSAGSYSGDTFKALDINLSWYTFDVGYVQEMSAISMVSGSSNNPDYRNTGSGFQVLVMSGANINEDGSSPDPQTFKDTNFFVSGTKGTKDSTTRGTAVFGGDTVISGALYVDQYITHLGDADTYIRFGQDSVGDRLSLAAGELIGIRLYEKGSNDRVYVGSDGTEASKFKSVLILSGGAAASTNEAEGTDVAFYVSGTVGSKGSATRGASLIGGDLVISGSVWGEMIAGSKTIFDVTADQLRFQNADGRSDSTGNDVSFWVSGSIGTKDSQSERGTARFGGDLAVSGAIHAIRDYSSDTDASIVVENSNNASNSHAVIELRNVESEGDNSGFRVEKRGIGTSMNGDIILGHAAHLQNRSGSMIFHIGTGSFGEADPWSFDFIAGDSRSYLHTSGSVGGQVFILSGGNSADTNNVKNYKDTSFFVSGTVGSKNGSSGGTSVFGGDVVISGSLTDGDGNPITGGGSGDAVGWFSGSSATHGNLGIQPNWISTSGSLAVTGSADIGGDALITGSIYFGGSSWLVKAASPNSKIGFGGDGAIQLRTAGTNRFNSYISHFDNNSALTLTYISQSRGRDSNDEGPKDNTVIKAGTADQSIRFEGFGGGLGSSVKASLATHDDYVTVMTGALPSRLVDTNFFVSGTIGSKNTATRGASVFGGDLVVSGVIHGGVNSDVSTDLLEMNSSLILANGPGGLTSIPGLDTNFYVSGTVSSAGTSTRGASVFGGDLVVSGGIWGLDAPFVAYKVSTSPRVGIGTITPNAELHISGAAGSDAEIIVQGRNISTTYMPDGEYANKQISTWYYEDESSYMGLDIWFSGSTGGLDNTDAGTIHLDRLYKLGSHYRFDAMKSASTAVMPLAYSGSISTTSPGLLKIMSGTMYANTTTSPDLMTDTNLWISGSINAKNSETRGTSVFGGDVVTSGTLYALASNAGLPAVAIGTVDGATGIGNDAHMWVSGALGSRGTTTRGTSVFGGDLVISGGLDVNGTTFVVDEVNNRVGIGTSSPSAYLHVSGAATTYTQISGKNALQILECGGGLATPAALIYFYKDNSAKSALLYTSGAASGLNSTPGSSFNFWGNEYGTHLVSRVAKPSGDFIYPWVYSGSIDNNDPGMFLIMSGGGGASDNPHRSYSDTNFFVSGTIGSKGSSARGTALFGGDAVVSGNLHMDTGRSFYLSNDQYMYANGSTLTIDGDDVIDFKADTDVQWYSPDFHFNRGAGGVDFKIYGGGTPIHYLMRAWNSDAVDARVFFLSGSRSSSSSPDEWDYADTAFFVSGAVGSKNSGTRGTSVFGGDLVVSGVLHGGDQLSIGNTTEITGALYLQNQASAPAVAAAGQGVLYSRADALYFKNAGGVETALGSGGGGGGASTVGWTAPSTQYISATGSVLLGASTVGAADIVLSGTGDAVFNKQSNMVDFRVATPNKSYALFVSGGRDQVTILSGGMPSSPDSAAGSDVAFFVSGTLGNKDSTSVRGTSLFGGDLVVSGAIVVPTTGSSWWGNFDPLIKIDPQTHGIGIGTNSTEDAIVEINHSAGDEFLNKENLRLSYNDSDGSAASYVTFNVDDTKLEIGGALTNDILVTENDFHVKNDGAIFGNVGSLALYQLRIEGGDEGSYGPTNSTAAGVAFTDGANVLAGIVSSGSGDQTGDLRFYTKEHTGVMQRPEERLRITNDGQIFFNTGSGAAASPDESAYTDISFFVSGAIGSAGSTTKGTSLFGGDLHISGNLTVGGSSPGGGGSSSVGWIATSPGQIDTTGSVGVTGSLDVAGNIRHIGDESNKITFSTSKIDIWATSNRQLTINSVGTHVNAYNNALDFRVDGDTRDNVLLVSGSTDQVLILSGGGASSTDEAKGSDVAFYVSGTVSSAGTSTRGTSVFGGDVVISGNHYVGVSGSGQQVTFYGNDAAAIGMRWDPIGAETPGDDESGGALVIGQNNDGADFIAFGKSVNNYMFWDANQDRFTVIGLQQHWGGNVIFNDGAGQYDFRVETENKTHALFLDGEENQIGLGVSSMGSDAFVFVSGTIGAMGDAAAKGTTVFGGDVLVSGSVSLARTANLAGGDGLCLGVGPSAISTAYATSDASTWFSGSVGGKDSPTERGVTVFAGDVAVSGSVIPGLDSTINLGSPTNRFANVYTGDLHLRNDRGNWTIVEEEEYLCVINNATGKKFKMVLEPLD